ncbi:MAG: tryptophan--tRNA ligase [Candidatus Moranbacteria bacterium]|jgi:tryptophanyl-tRNA synthetase|nr:tryptophan--tRNA ligase [Candidatus Moranbacteria bacterium]
MKRLFSGIQPSGNLHLGNYLGALKQWVDMQNEHEAIFCIVDLHAITVPQDPVALREKALELAKIFLASGIDPEKATLFIQSHVSAHTELAWILNTIARMAELERMTQFKDKAQKGSVSESGVGLFDYPVLMAADILLYDTNVVPVGKDQLQHIELARDLAERFNKRFGETFVIPEGQLSKEGQLIMGLDDPSKKMSKSAPSEYNYIALTDDADTVRRKIKKAVTDSGSEIVYSDDPSNVEAGKPALRNLINIYSLLSGKTPKEIEEMYAGKGYGDFKTDLAEVIVNFLVPFQERLAALSDETVLAILKAGAEKVRPLAEAKLRQVYDKVGLIS